MSTGGSWEQAGGNAAEADLGMWRPEADFTDADRLVVRILRRHLAETGSDECLLWLVRLVSNPRLVRKEAALQRRMGRIPDDRPLGLKIRDRRAFADELVALVGVGAIEPHHPGSGDGAASTRPDLTAPAHAEVLDRGRRLGMWLVRSVAWLGAYLLVLALLRRWS